MNESTVNTGRSSFVDIYQSDGGTNSDTINDFSQYSDNEILKVDFQEKIEDAPQPFMEKNIPISSDNITFTPKPPNGVTNGIEIINGNQSESEEEDDSRYEITKKKTIRKIISKTTSINGVEKENEVKEFLIKDSQVNDDGSPFSKSRRGSHVSVRRPSVDSRVSKGGRSKTDRSQSKVDVGEMFRSELEKINDEEEVVCARKTFCDQGLSWVSPYDAVDADEGVPMRPDIEEKIEALKVVRQLQASPPKTVTDGYLSKSEAVKWVDPGRAHHLKYDSKSDDDVRKRSKDSGRHDIEKDASRTKDAPVIKPSKDSIPKMNAISTSKAPLGPTIRDYIARGNIKENQYLKRRTQLPPQMSQSISAIPSKQDPKNFKKSSQHKSCEKATSISGGYSKSKEDVRPSPKSPSRYCIIKPQHQSLQRFGSIDSINNYTDYTVLKRSDSPSAKSKIYMKAPDEERRLSQSNQSLPHRCPDNFRPYCSYYCRRTSSCTPLREQESALSSALRPESTFKDTNYYQPRAVSSRSRGSGSRSYNPKDFDDLANKSAIQIEKKETSILEKRIHILEDRLHSLQKDLKEYKYSEDNSGTESEASVKSQCRHVERELQILCKCLHHIRGVS